MKMLGLGQVTASEHAALLATVRRFEPSLVRMPRGEPNALGRKTSDKLIVLSKGQRLNDDLQKLQHILPKLSEKVARPHDMTLGLESTVQDRRRNSRFVGGQCLRLKPV